MYIVRLYRDGIYYSETSLDCGPKTFKNACAQWRRNGFAVTIIFQPKGK